MDWPVEEQRAVMTCMIRPLSAVAAEPVKEYLTGLGESEAIVEWKYFDHRFNQGRERGYVWIVDGRVQGFIGLIPFRIMHNRREMSVAWSCDWSVDQRAHQHLTGVLLVRESLRPYEYILSSGGNEKTRRIFSQIATATTAEAGVTLHAPLRMGCLLQVLRGSLGGHLLGKMHWLSQLPLRKIGRRLPKCNVTTERGISAAIVPLLDRCNKREDCPLYDFEYLHWQIGRCPALESHTVYVAGAGGVHAALLLWCSAMSRDFWRIAVVSADAGRDEVDSLITAALSFVYAEGGMVVSVGASRHQTQFIENLRERGFIVSPRRRPLYILSGHSGRQPIPDLRQLSYLDTDWAYRLPVQYPGVEAVRVVDSAGAPAPAPLSGTRR